MAKKYIAAFVLPIILDYKLTPGLASSQLEYWYSARIAVQSGRLGE